MISCEFKPGQLVTVNKAGLLGLVTERPFKAWAEGLRVIFVKVHMINSAQTWDIPIEFITLYKDIINE